MQPQCRLCSLSVIKSSLLHKASENVQKYIVDRRYSVKSKLQTMIYSSALVPSRIKIVHRRYQGKADLLRLIRYFHIGAMDWTALQRVSLALTSGAPCLAVQSAREQQSLHTWFVQYGSSGIADVAPLHVCSIFTYMLRLFTDSLAPTALLQIALGR